MPDKVAENEDSLLYSEFWTNPVLVKRQVEGISESMKRIKETNPVNTRVVQQIKELRQVGRRMKASHSQKIEPIVTAKLVKAFKF